MFIYFWFFIYVRQELYYQAILPAQIDFLAHLYLMCVSVLVHLCASYIPSGCQGQKTESDLLELELEKDVSHHVCSENRIQPVLLTTEPSFQPAPYSQLLEQF